MLIRVMCARELFIDTRLFMTRLKFKPYKMKDFPQRRMPVITFMISESINGRIFDIYFSLG